MFTGLVQAIGRVTACSSGTFTIAAGFAADLAIGESVAVAGICLTATHIVREAFDVDVSPTTAALTTADGWEVGQRVNLERALALGDRLGGHVVTGHVDTTGTLLERLPADSCCRLRVAFPSLLAAHFIPCGSVTLDGVSLTVNEVDEESFWVTIIPQTLAETTLAFLAPGDRVNLETDLIGKYVERVLAVRGAIPVSTGRC